MSYKNSYMNMKSTAMAVRNMLEKEYSKRTIRLYLRDQKKKHGITKHNLKKFYKQEYGEELILGR